MEWVFKLKPLAKGTLGRPGTFDNKAREGYTDQALIGDIDFQGQIEDNCKEAEEEYDLVASLFGGTIPRLDFTWRSLVADDSPHKDLGRQALLDMYGAQPAVIACDKVRENNRKNPNTKVREISAGLDLDAFQCSREEYVARVRNNAISTFAVIKDGKWYERGTMGWWGIVSNEQDKDAWVTRMSELLKSLTPDTLVSVYDCHV